MVGIDKDLVKLDKILPNGNIPNVEECFKDGMVQSYCHMTSYSIFGSGPEITVPDYPAEQKKIRTFNENINVKGETIDDFLRKAWFDAIKYDHYAWRVAHRIRDINNKIRELPDIQRMPPMTYKIKYEPYTGWAKFEQIVSTTAYHQKPEDWLNRKHTYRKTGFSKIRFLGKKHIVLFDTLFDQAPMKKVVPLVTFKRWILAFMRKFAEKLWAPPIYATVGNNFGYPNGEWQMKEALAATVTRLSQLKNYSVGAFPGSTDIKALQIKQNGNIYLEYYDKMNEQIMFYLYSSIANRIPAGVYKSGDLPDEANIRFLEGIRDKLQKKLKEFYIANITPNLIEDNIKFDWPQIRNYNMDQQAKAIDIAVKSGVFRDAQERRDAFATIVNTLDGTDQLTPEEIIRLDKEFITMLAPSQPGMSTVAAAGGKTQEPKTVT